MSAIRILEGFEACGAYSALTINCYTMFHFPPIILNKLQREMMLYLSNHLKTTHIPRLSYFVSQISSKSCMRALDSKLLSSSSRKRVSSVLLYLLIHFYSTSISSSSGLSHFTSAKDEGPALQNRSLCKKHLTHYRASTMIMVFGDSYAPIDNFILAAYVRINYRGHEETRYNKHAKQFRQRLIDVDYLQPLPPTTINRRKYHGNTNVNSSQRMRQGC